MALHGGAPGGVWVGQPCQMLGVSIIQRFLNPVSGQTESPESNHLTNQEQGEMMDCPWTNQ